MILPPDHLICARTPGGTPVYEDHCQSTLLFSNSKPPKVETIEDIVAHPSSSPSPSPSPSPYPSPSQIAPTSSTPSPHHHVDEMHEECLCKSNSKGVSSTQWPCAFANPCTALSQTIVWSLPMHIIITIGEDHLQPPRPSPSPSVGDGDGEGSRPPYPIGR